MAIKNFTLEDALHVVPGHSASGNLKYCGCREIVVLDDPLFPGPCDTDPERHSSKRKAFLKERSAPYTDPICQYWKFVAEGLMCEGELARFFGTARKPIVIWTSREFTNRLAFWWLADAIQRSRTALDNYWVVAPRVDREWDILGHAPGIGAFTPAELRKAFDTRRQLTRISMVAQAKLWKKYAGRSPRDFDRERKSLTLDRNLNKDTRIYSAFFPQISAAKKSQLRLSEFDQLLFNGLVGPRWLRPWDLMNHNHDLIRYVGLGSEIIAVRLHEWSMHSPSNPALEIRKEADGFNEFRAFACRLTPHGKRLRDYGLETVTEGPPMSLGGCTAYMQRPAWVRWNRGNQTWIDVLR